MSSDEGCKKVKSGKLQTWAGHPNLEYYFTISVEKFQIRVPTSVALELHHSMEMTEIYSHFFQKNRESKLHICKENGESKFLQFQQFRC